MMTDTLALIDAYYQANSASLPSSISAVTAPGVYASGVDRICNTIGALCAAHAAMADPLRTASRTLAQQLIAYAQPFGWWTGILDYNALTAQLAADDAPPAAPAA